MNKVMKIDIVSDFACPWCYMGGKRLKKALDQRTDLSIDVNWKPFQLNSDIGAEGINRNLYYFKKFGMEQFKSMFANLKKVGLDEGIDFCESDSAIAPNTLSAHRLMYWASQDENVDSSLLHEKLFKAHHEECTDIGSLEVLLGIAGEIGMDRSEVEEKLKSGVDEDLIKSRIQESYEKGINGVPFFIINDKYTISGAQETEYFLSAIDHIIKKEESE